MLSKNTGKIINYLLRELELKNINQISKKTKTSIGSAFKILKDLEKRERVLVKQMGNSKFYSLNFNNKETIKLCELLLLEEKQNLKGYAKIYADEIAPRGVPSEKGKNTDF